MGDQLPTPPESTEGTITVSKVTTAQVALSAHLSCDPLIDALKSQSFKSQELYEKLISLARDPDPKVSFPALKEIRKALMDTAKLNSLVTTSHTQEKDPDNGSTRSSTSTGVAVFESLENSQPPGTKAQFHRHNAPAKVESETGSGGGSFADRQIPEGSGEEEHPSSGSESVPDVGEDEGSGHSTSSGDGSA